MIIVFKCYISDVIGQVNRAMIFNKIIYDAITSWTRTHFVEASTLEKKSFLLIYRLCYVGELNYFRAWAHFAHSRFKESKNFFPKAPMRMCIRSSPRPELKRFFVILHVTI